MNSRYFLGKGGQQFGPYTEAQIQAFRDSGEISTYTWIWDEKNGWQPVDAKPAASPGAPGPVPPDQLAAAPTPTPVPRSVPRAQPEPEQKYAPAPVPRQRPDARYYQTHLKAVCLDQDQAMSAALAKVNDDGCELVSAAQCASPQFVSSGTATLNLFDEKSGKSVNVPVKISDVTRSNGVWTYRVRWRECPELVHSTAA